MCFKPGNRVCYNGNLGTVTKRRPSDRMSDDYLVVWDHGHTSWTRGSDLSEPGRIICTATDVLTETEMSYLEGLPRSEFLTDPTPIRCEFTQHDSRAPHTAFVQSQSAMDRHSDVIVWWLRWDEDGWRDIVTAPTCYEPVEDEFCILISRHPGDHHHGVI